MAIYKYTGIAWQGGKVSGTVDAYSENEAMLRIHDTCQVVLSIRKSLLNRRGAWDSVEEDEESQSLLQKLNNIEIGGSRLNEKVFAVMCNQFAAILRSGMPVARAVQMVIDTLPDRKLQSWLKKVLRDVESGMPLADSMANRGAAFLPTTFVETVRAGETSGNLDLSFENMARHFEKQSKMKAQIRGAMAYPILLLVVGVAVMAVIMVYVIPMFTQIFEKAGAQIPPLTAAVIGMSNFVKNYWWSFLLMAGGGFGLWKLLDAFPRTRLLLARILLRLPVVGKISLLSASCQFANTMATLVSSGLAIINAVEITSNVIENPYMKKAVSDVVPMLEQGSSLGDALRSGNAFPAMLTEMTALGENSGDLQQTLSYIGKYYDNELEIATNAAVKKLAPAMLAVIGGLAIFMVGGVYVGMFGMYDAMGAALTA